MRPPGAEQPQVKQGKADAGKHWPSTASTTERFMSDLNLGMIGNCSISALIDRQATVVWSCQPRLDGDPVFHALIDGNAPLADRRGYWSVELDGQSASTQQYRPNTAILVTRLEAADGAAIEVVDFCPRFEHHGRMFRPRMMVRTLRPVAGRPKVLLRMRPSFEHGSLRPAVTHGSNHVRWVGAEQALRCTTNAPVSYLLAETPFCLEEALSFVFGADEALYGGVADTARDFMERTERFWRLWSRGLALPLEWQEAVIRAAITLKLCSFEETGAIVAAMTTSVLEAPHTERAWDYRFCWLRDAFFVIRALNSLGAMDTMEHYLRYLGNVVETARDGHLQPVYGIALEQHLIEREVPTLAGYKGMGPVRVGNQAYEHLQHDVYGNVILAAAQWFFDQRLLRPGTREDFERLEAVGEQAYRVYATPDAGMWELRSRARVHTSSALMCWAACDRLAKIARHLKRDKRATLWATRAEEIRAAIEREAWNEQENSYAESFGGRSIEAGLLLMAEVGYIHPRHPRFLGTLAAVERHLKRGPYHLFRYAEADDFGTPHTAFNICTFWYLDALLRVGRRREARALFEHMLSCRNHVGLLSEDIDPKTSELWGNFPQTYSMVGIINAAVRLSRGWEKVV
jgi:GH15 family glucan-1,4-alpha-glucosidase